MNNKLNLGAIAPPPPAPGSSIYAFSEQRRDVLMMESILNMLNSVKSANYTLSHDAIVLLSFGWSSLL